jgi:hypothetical protein
MIETVHRFDACSYSLAFRRIVRKRPTEIQLRKYPRKPTTNIYRNAVPEKAHDPSVDAVTALKQVYCSLPVIGLLGTMVLTEALLEHCTSIAEFPRDGDARIDAVPDNRSKKSSVPSCDGASNRTAYTTEYSKLQRAKKAADQTTEQKTQAPNDFGKIHVVPARSNVECAACKYFFRLLSRVADLLTASPHASTATSPRLRCGSA